MEAKKRELGYRACVSGRFPWTTTRATPRAPEGTKIAHLAASFRRARHGSATPNPPPCVQKRTSATATTARNRHRRFGRKSGKNAGFAVAWSRAALVGPSPSLACSRTMSLAFSHRYRFRSRDMKRTSDQIATIAYPVQGHRAFFLIIFKRLQQLGVFILSVEIEHPIPVEYHQVRMPELGFWRSMRRASAKKNMRFSMLTFAARKRTNKRQTLDWGLRNFVAPTLNRSMTRAARPRPTPI